MCLIAASGAPAGDAADPASQPLPACTAQPLPQYDALFQRRRGWTGGDELVITYVANSTDFARCARDARIYWPRFARVKFDASR